MTMMPRSTTRCIPGHDIAGQGRQSATPMRDASRAIRPAIDLLRSAANAPPTSLDTQVRQPLERRLDLDLGYIRIRSGRASDAATGDAAKGTVENEHATARALASPTFAAVTAFNEFYQNPGSSKAPK